MLTIKPNPSCKKNKLVIRYRLMDNEENVLPIGKKSVFLISAFCLIAVLILLVINVFMRASILPGRTILPGGVTYLGPSSE